MHSLTRAILPSQSGPLTTHRSPLTTSAKWLTPLLACWLLSGCVAFTNPVANGVPVRLLPPEILGEPQADKKPIPLSLLRQKAPEVYRLAPGDTLSILIEGVLGERGQVPPVQTTDQPESPPAIG